MAEHNEILPSRFSVTLYTSFNNAGKTDIFREIIKEFTNYKHFQEVIKRCCLVKKKGKRKKKKELSPKGVGNQKK